MKWFLQVGATMALLVYLVGSFTVWNFNPAVWEPFGRFMAGFVWMLTSILLGAAGAESSNYD